MSIRTQHDPTRKLLSTPKVKLSGRGLKSLYLTKDNIPNDKFSQKSPLLALTTRARDIVFRFTIEYSSLLSTPKVKLSGRGPAGLSPTSLLQHQWGLNPQPFFEIPGILRPRLYHWGIYHPWECFGVAGIKFPLLLLFWTLQNSHFNQTLELDFKQFLLIIIFLWHSTFWIMLKSIWSSSQVIILESSRMYEIRLLTIFSLLITY